jgi:hypothetical protein
VENRLLFNKKGLITIKLAKELLQYSPGDRIDTVDSYSKRFHCSRGIIQEALAVIEADRAIKTEKRGSLGTFLQEIDYKKLIKLANWGIFTGASPLPYTRRVEGFATAIYHEMESKGIPFHFAYMQGARNRAAGVLNNKYVFALMSKTSALDIISEQPELSILMEFEDFTYTGGYALLFKDDAYADKDVIRVGIDRNSPEHVDLISKIFSGRKAEYVEVQYTRMIPEILSGGIDVTVYNKDVLALQIVYENIKFKDIELSAKDLDATRTVLLIHKEDYGIANVLNEIIKIDSVTKIMNEVVTGKSMPVY